MRPLSVADLAVTSPDTVGRYRVEPNGRGAHEWMGPRPPAGHGMHRSSFWAYALARSVDGAPPREELLDRYADDGIEQNRPVVTFERAPEA